MSKKKKRRPRPSPKQEPEATAEEASSDPGTAGFPRPVAFLQTLGVAWRVYASRWQSYVGLYLIFYVAFAAITLGLLASPLSPSIGLLAQTILAPILGSMAVAISAPVMADELAGVDTSLSEGMSIFRERRRDVIAAALLAGLLTTILIQIGGLLGYFISFALLGPPILAQVVTIENLALSEAWTRTKVLMKLEWGRLLMYLINISLAIGFASFFAVTYVSYGTREANDVLQAGVVFLLDAVLLALTLPFLSAMQAVSYLDVRARKEDLDEAEWASERSRPTSSTED